MNESALAGACTPANTSLSLEHLVRRYSSPIGSLLRRLGVASRDVDDVLQRVWLIAWHCLNRVRAGSERAFLWTVARREGGHELRSYRRRPEYPVTEIEELAASSLTADECLNRRQQMEHVQAVLQQLDVSLRDVLLLFEVHDASSRDVARLLDIPVGTAKSRLRRARADCARIGLARAQAGGWVTTMGLASDATSRARGAEPRNARAARHGSGAG